jgi:hypothetical protein
MKRLMLAGSLLVWTTTSGLADGTFWVVGNQATGKCQIVTTNPVIGGDIYFGDGPYKSRDDAKLSRSTIPACPKLDPKQEKEEDEAAGK